MSRFLRFLAELRRRHVIRVALAYVVVAFGIFEGTDLLVFSLGLPGWTTTMVVVLGIAAFPLALVLNWAYETGSDGIRRDPGPDGPEEAAREGAGTSLPPPRSLAVLPLATLSGDPENQYFGDGLAEEILNLLAGLPQLRVPSRTSSFSFRDAGLDQTTVWLATWAEDTAERRREAESTSRRALELAPARAEAHTARGHVLTLDQRWDEAKTHFERAIRLDPGLYDAWYLYARARFAQGRLEHAAELFAKAAEVRPDDYQSRALQAQTLVALGRTDEARTVARAAAETAELHLELHPDDSRALTLGAGAWIDAGEREKGIRWADRAVAMHPEDVPVLHNAACVFAAVGEIDRSLDLLERRIRIAPTLSRAWIEHDPDFETLRDHPGSRPWWKISRDSGHFPASSLVGPLWKNLSDPDSNLVILKEQALSQEAVMNYNPTVDYRSDRVESPPESRGEQRSRVTDIATRGALSMALAVWAVIGFLLWIPLLFRRILSFVVSLTYVTVTNGDPDPAARRLRSATSFYRRGFETAARCVLSAPADGSDDPPPVRKPISARPVLQEIAWALVVWYPVLLWLGVAEWGPTDLWHGVTDLWRWVQDAPWSEVAKSSVEATATWVESLASRLGL